MTTTPCAGAVVLCEVQCKTPRMCCQRTHPRRRTLRLTRCASPSSSAGGAGEVPPRGRPSSIVSPCTVISPITGEHDKGVDSCLLPASNDVHRDTPRHAATRHAVLHATSRRATLDTTNANHTQRRHVTQRPPRSRSLRHGRVAQRQATCHAAPRHAASNAMCEEQCM